MFVTFLILFREGLEAFLLVGILLAYLKQLGGGQYAKWIYVGVLAGIVGSFFAAVILQVVVDQFSNELYRSVLTAAIMLAATVILTYMAIWMGKQAKAHTDEAKRRLESHLGAGNVIGIAALAFFSVFREGLETVLFLSALSMGGEAPSLLGGIVGLVLSAVLVALLVRGARRIPFPVFFRYTSLLLLVIAAGLLGSSVNMLQSAGVLAGSTAPLFDISTILPDTSGVGAFLRGLVGYNATPTAAQFALWALYLAAAVVLWRRSYAAKA